MMITMMIGKKALNLYNAYYTSALSLDTSKGIVRATETDRMTFDFDGKYVEYVYCNKCKSFEPALLITKISTKKAIPKKPNSPFDNEKKAMASSDIVYKIKKNRFYSYELGKTSRFYCSKCRKRLNNNLLYIDLYEGANKPVAVCLFKEKSKKGQSLLGINFLYRHVSAYGLKLQVSKPQRDFRITINLDTACIYKITRNKIQNITYKNMSNLDVPGHIFNLICKEIFEHYRAHYPEISPSKIQFLYNGTNSKQKEVDFASVQRLVAAPMLTDEQFKLYFINKEFDVKDFNNALAATKQINALRKHIRSNRFITVGKLSNRVFKHSYSATKNLNPKIYTIFNKFVDYEFFVNYYKLFSSSHMDTLYNFITSEYTQDYRDYLKQVGFNEKKIQRTIFSKILYMRECNKNYLEDMMQMYLRLKYADTEGYVFDKRAYMQKDFLYIHDLMAVDYRKVDMPRLNYEYTPKVLKLNKECKSISIRLASGSAELATYGEKLHICVQSYWQQAYYNKCHILFMFDNDTGEVEGCIEVSPEMRIKQIKGRRNGSIRHDLKPEVSEWIAEKQLRLDTEDLNITTYHEHVEGENPYGRYIAQHM